MLGIWGKGNSYILLVSLIYGDQEEYIWSKISWEKRSSVEYSGEKCHVCSFYFSWWIASCRNPHAPSKIHLYYII